RSGSRGTQGHCTSFRRNIPSSRCWSGSELTPAEQYGSILCAVNTRRLANSENDILDDDLPSGVAMPRIVCARVLELCRSGKRLSAYSPIDYEESAQEQIPGTKGRADLVLRRGHRRNSHI